MTHPTTTPPAGQRIPDWAVRLIRWGRNIAVGAVAIAVVYGGPMALGAAIDRLDAATSTTKTAATRPNPSPGHEWPDATGMDRADRTKVLDALDIIDTYDPARLVDMRERPWTLRPAPQEMPDSMLARTESHACVTELDMADIAQDATAAGITPRYWLAAVLVHERAHCEPGGRGSERLSLQEQTRFVVTWPPSEFGAGLKAMMQLDRQLDGEGRWATAT
jgi:hypothetical protein